MLLWLDELMLHTGCVFAATWAQAGRCVMNDLMLLLDVCMVYTYDII
jgi:hypothetical protein